MFASPDIIWSTSTHKMALVRVAQLGASQDLPPVTIQGRLDMYDESLPRLRGPATAFLVIDHDALE